MTTEDQAKRILRGKANYIVRSLFEISDHYGMLREKDGVGCVVLPYLFLKRILFIIIEEYEELGIESGGDEEETGQRIDRLLDEVLETYFLAQPLPDKDRDELVYVSGYLPDEENGLISLFFATLLCKKVIGEQELDERGRFFVDFIEEYGKPKYLSWFATPKDFEQSETSYEKQQDRPFRGWEKRLREYMDRIQRELGESGGALKNRAEEQLAKKLSYVSGEETRGTRGNTYDQQV